MKQRFADILKTAIDSYFSKIHTCIPGQIESFNALLNKASVKPLIKRKVGKNILSLPVITEVPVQFPSSGNVGVVFPLNRGDGCLILFSEVSLENYLNSIGNEVEPGDDRTFSLSDAVCIPGVSPFSKPGTLKGDGLSIKMKYGDYEVILNAAGIILKSTDSAIWAPNILTIDPVTGIPHGGIGAGIVKLRGL